MEEKKDSTVKSTSEVPRTFLSPAFLVEVEPRIFGLYRSLEMEEFDQKNGCSSREKIKDIGPISLFRECERDEKEDLVSFHPTEHRPMRIRRVD